MLKRDNKFTLHAFCCLLLFSCNNLNTKSLDEKKAHYLQKTDSLIGYDQRISLYSQASDSLESWYHHNLLIDSVYEDNSNKLFLISKAKLDSIICINSKKDKLIGVLLNFGDGYAPKMYLESIKEFYGAKIKGKWYFWTGGEQAVSRSLFKGHNPRKPLSYAQLHSQAINWMSGYLKKDGSINDEWFEFMFNQDQSKNDFETRYKFDHYLDGHQIDNEKEYWEYQYKKKGLGLWIAKISKDSIFNYNMKNPKNKLTREQEIELSIYFSRLIMNMPEKLKKK